MATHELGKHWWYRLIKVGYLSALTLSLLFTIYFASDDGISTVDLESSIVTCAPDNAKAADNRQSFPNAPRNLTLDQLKLDVPTSAFNDGKLNYVDLFKMGNDDIIKAIAKTCNNGYSQT